jgi:hypothetical protein
VNGVAYVLTLSSIALWASTAECQEPASSDPVVASPRQFTVLLNNEQVRVVEYSFNEGDATTTDAGCSHVTSSLDDFPPHEWHGADACRSWMRTDHTASI